MRTDNDPFENRSVPDPARQEPIMLEVSLPLALAGGSWIFLGFELFMVLAVAYGYYTVGGSAISQHPYGNLYGGAPAARTPSELSDHHVTTEIRNWTRGTR